MRKNEFTTNNMLWVAIVICAAFALAWIVGGEPKKANLAVQDEKPMDLDHVLVEMGIIHRSGGDAFHADHYIMWSCLADGGFLIVARDKEDGIGYAGQFAAALNELDKLGYKPKLAVPRMPEGNDYRALFVWATKEK